MNDATAMDDEPNRESAQRRGREHGPDVSDNCDGGRDDRAPDHEGHHHSHHHGRHAMMVHNHRDVQGGTVRAAVFGVSDGLVSNVALILGVAAAASDSSAVIVAGMAGLLAGAASMAAGEYVSVKAQVELIERELEIERKSIKERPALEIAELASIYRQRGVAPDQAKLIATAVMDDPEVALEVHAREELGVDPETAGGNPLGAAASSFLAFGIGAVLPLVPWFVAAGNAAVLASIVVGFGASALVGGTLAVFTERSKFKTAARQVGLAALACAVTWAVGSWLGATVV